ncbi:MAG: protease modulator HflC [Candidatus Muirbacterium halophilum]|nr:protease modulator HflC [Candidatus Muirbacterium halophilum]MCK9475162.1 protease modulator HflC [Candidatus Muirbacterium halophilum]
MKKILIFLAILLLIILKVTVFFVDETKFAIILRFGEFQKTIYEPGLNFKLPDPVESVVFFEKRILDYDTLPREIITKDKKALVIDNYAKWKIIDPIIFFKKVANEISMNARLDDIVYSLLREELGQHDLIEIVRDNRQIILDKVTADCDAMVQDYGISIIDVRIKRADLPQENEKSVFDRMKAERKRIANQYENEGHREAEKIRSGVEREVTVMRAGAYRKSQEIIGQAENEAIKIYADVYSQKDAKEFFEFLKKLELVEKTFGENTKIIMSTESELFNILEDIK